MPKTKHFVPTPVSSPKPVTDDPRTVYFYVIEAAIAHQNMPYAVVHEFDMPCSSVPVSGDVLLTGEATYRVHPNNLFNGGNTTTSGVFKTVNGTLVVVPIRFLMEEAPAEQPTSKDYAMTVRTRS